jgi:hypothetical protein
VAPLIRSSGVTLKAFGVIVSTLGDWLIQLAIERTTSASHVDWLLEAVTFKEHSTMMRLAKNKCSPKKTQVCGASFLLFGVGELLVIAFHGFADSVFGFFDPIDLVDPGGLAVLKFFIHLEEMHDFVEDVLGKIFDVFEGVIKGVMRADRDDLLIGRTRVVHLKDSNRIA